MMRSPFTALALLVLVAFTAMVDFASGTSVIQKAHTCPVCGTVSMAAKLASYSSFGEPATDLSDQIMFAFNNPEVCPADLYCALGNGWDKVSSEDRAALAEFLKAPALVLTPTEKRIIGDHWEEFRTGRFHDLLWARSCQSVRAPDPRADWMLVMKLAFSGLGSPEPWEMELAGEYREQAIRMLAEGKTADWTTEADKRILPYLHAEFTRQAGRTDAARTLFLQVIEAEKQLPQEEDGSWLTTMAARQVKTIDTKDASTAGLIASLLDPAPGTAPDQKLILEELKRRTSQEDASASAALLTHLKTKPDPLEAALDIIGDRDLAQLRDTDDDWRAFFAEIRGLYERRSSSPPGGNMVTTNRVPDLALMPESFRADWRKRVLLPEVIRTLEHGGVPKVRQSGAELLYSLAQLAETQDEEGRAGSARIMIRVMRSMKLEKADLEYRSKYACRVLARLKADPALLPELKGTWKSVFWQAVCETLLGVPGADRRLAEMPDGGKIGKAQKELMSGIVWTIFAERKSPAGKKKLPDTIRSSPWLDNEVLSYALALDDPEVENLLQARITRLKKAPPGKTPDRIDGMQISQIEDALTEKRLRTLPIR